MKELFHVDAVQLVVLIAGFIAMFVRLKGNTEWQGTWIKKHSEECDQREKTVNKILVELQTSNAHLTTLTVNQGDRISRLEHQADRVAGWTAPR